MVVILPDTFIYPGFDCGSYVGPCQASTKTNTGDLGLESVEARNILFQQPPFRLYVSWKGIHASNQQNLAETCQTDVIQDLLWMNEILHHLKNKTKNKKNNDCRDSIPP